MIITAQAIADAKLITHYTSKQQLHEHDDCIRIACQWLDAQIRCERPRRNFLALKHCIEQWGGRYVSRSDVEVAATMLGLSGRYPNFNYSRRLVLPSMHRLADIPEAGTMSNYRNRHQLMGYHWQETSDGQLKRLTPGHRSSQPAPSEAV